LYVAWLWLVIAVVLGVAEVFTTTFVLIMFAAGAAAAAVGAAVGLPVWAQLLAFAAVSAGTLWLIRPAILHRMHQGGDTARVGLAAIEGSAGVVLERVDPDHGMIKIDGEVWTARPYDGLESFEPGERVRVIEINGATALVWKEF
jgi:membrane protein implicated in regulation of membrane protease activity